MDIKHLVTVSPIDRQLYSIALDQNVIGWIIQPLANVQKFMTLATYSE